MSSGDDPPWPCPLCEGHLESSPNDMTFHLLKSHSSLELAAFITKLLTTSKQHDWSKQISQSLGSEPMGYLDQDDNDDGSMVVKEEEDQDGEDKEEQEEEKLEEFVKKKEEKVKTSPPKSVSKPRSQKKTKYECDICLKVLSCQGNLNKHKVVHAKTKPWKCDDCGLQFNQKRDYETHKMQKHSEARPFKCQVYKS